MIKMGQLILFRRYKMEEEYENNGESREKIIDLCKAQFKTKDEINDCIKKRTQK